MLEVVYETLSFVGRLLEEGLNHGLRLLVTLKLVLHLNIMLIELLLFNNRHWHLSRGIFKSHVAFQELVLVCPSSYLLLPEEVTSFLLQLNHVAVWLTPEIFKPPSIEGLLPVHMLLMDSYDHCIENEQLLLGETLLEVLIAYVLLLQVQVTLRSRGA